MAITFDPRIDGYLQTSRIYATQMNPVNSVDESFTSQQVENDPYYHQVAIEDQIANGIVDLQQGDTLGNVVDGMQEILASDSTSAQPSDQDVINELIMYNPELAEYINDMGFNTSTMTASQVQDLLSLDLNKANIVKLNVQKAMEDLKNHEINNPNTPTSQISGQANVNSNMNPMNVDQTNTPRNPIIHNFNDPLSNQNPVSFGNSMPDNMMNIHDFTSTHVQPPFRGAEPDPDEFSHLNAKNDNSQQMHALGPNNMPFGDYLSDFDHTGFGQAIRNRLPSALHGIETQMHLETEPEEAA